MSYLITALTQPLKMMRHGLQTMTGITTSTNLVRPESFSVFSLRTKVRCYFPRPNEVRRVRRHGWQHRISTPNGRKVIMRRILKGRYVLTH